MEVSLDDMAPTVMRDIVQDAVEAAIIVWNWHASVIRPGHFVAHVVNPRFAFSFPCAICFPDTIGDD